MEADLQYLGSRPVLKMAAGLTVLQQPLKELYLPYMAPGHGFTLEDCHIRIHPGQGCHLSFHSPYSPATRDQFCAVTSFTLWYALRYATIKTKEKGTGLKGGFAPLDGTNPQTPVPSEGIYSTLEKDHKFLVKAKHPPLFVMVLRRTTGVHTLDLHAFICPSESVARNLVEAVNTTHKNYTHAQSGGAFGYSPFGGGSGGGESQVSPTGVGDMQQLAASKDHHKVLLSQNRDNKQLQNAVVRDESRKGVQQPSSDNQSSNQGDKHVWNFIISGNKDAGRAEQEINRSPSNRGLPRSPPVAAVSKEGASPKSEVNVRNLREANAAAKKNNAKATSGGGAAVVKSPVSPRSPDAARGYSNPPDNPVSHFYLSPPDTRAASNVGRLGNGYSLLSTSNEPLPGRPSPAQQHRGPMGQAAGVALGPPVHMGPFEDSPSDVPIVQRTRIHSTGHIVVGGNQTRQDVTPTSPERGGLPSHVLQSPSSHVSAGPTSPNHPANQLLSELRAFHANSQMSAPAREATSGQRHLNPSVQDTSSAAEARPVARVQGVRVLPSGGRPLRQRPKSEFYDRSPNWQLGSQISLGKDAESANRAPGSPRTGDKLLQGRKKDAEIADALSHLKFTSSDANASTQVPGAPRGLNFEQSLGYFP